MPTDITIKPKTELVYVSFSPEIIPNTTETLIATMANLANLQVKCVYLLLSRSGGSVMNGINLYNVLSGLPIELIVHNVGNVDSIGNAVFLAGTERLACPHSTFMFHGVGFDIPEGVRLEEKTIRERLDSILQDQARIGSIIMDRTNLDKRQVSKLRMTR